MHCEVPISVWEALRGARIRVPTPLGEAVLVVPPGTSAGQVFRLRGQGLPRLAEARRATSTSPCGSRFRAGSTRGPTSSCASWSGCCRARRGKTWRGTGEARRDRPEPSPLYMIGVVAEMLKVHPQTLRFYEKKGLVRPGRTEGQTRMYSEEDLEDIARLLRLTRDLGVNLAGVEIILKMRRRMIEMQKQIEDLLAYVREIRRRGEGGRAPRAARSAGPRGRQPAPAVDLF